MLIDLPINAQELAVISDHAKQHGVATADYIADLLRLEMRKDTPFYYDIDEMNEAINAPRVKVPANLSDEEFLTWVKNLKDSDFVEHS